MSKTYILEAFHIKNKPIVGKVIALGNFEHCLEALKRNEEFFKGYYLCIKELD